MFFEKEKFFFVCVCMREKNIWRERVTESDWGRKRKGERIRVCVCVRYTFIHNLFPVGRFTIFHLIMIVKFLCVFACVIADISRSIQNEFDMITQKITIKLFFFSWLCCRCLRLSIIRLSKVCDDENSRAYIPFFSLFILFQFWRHYCASKQAKVREKKMSKFFLFLERINVCATFIFICPIRATEHKKISLIRTKKKGILSGKIHAHTLCYKTIIWTYLINSF